MQLFLFPSPHVFMTSTKANLPLPNLYCLSHCDHRNINHEKRKYDNVAFQFGRPDGIENVIEELGFEPAVCKSFLLSKPTETSPGASTDSCTITIVSISQGQSGRGMELTIYHIEGRGWKFRPLKIYRNPVHLMACHGATFIFTFPSYSIWHLTAKLNKNK